MISIISSLYRTEAHLQRYLANARTISNELVKVDVNHEIVLIANDASPFEKKLLERLEKPFRVIYVPREPIYASWNRGVKNAKGDVVTFWGVDDTRYAKAIVDGLDTLESGADITYFPLRYHRFIRIFGLPVLVKVKTFAVPGFDQEIFKKEMHLGPHFLARKSVFDKVGYFDDSFKIAGDFAWQVEATRKGASFQPTYTVSGIFRNDGTTLSGSKDSMQKKENERIIRSTCIK